MSNGSMQFLGRQLAEQAKALGLLVAKMGEMVAKQDQLIPKYASPSDVLKVEKIVSITKSVEYQIITNLMDIQPQIYGKIRLKIVNVKSNTGATNIIISYNGITLTEKLLSTGDQTITQDIAVAEGGVISISGTSVSAGSKQ